MTIFDSKLGPLKALGVWVLPCLLSMAAYGAAEMPASVPARVSARGGSTPDLAVYVLLHRTRHESVSGDARARLRTCYDSASLGTRN